MWLSARPGTSACTGRVEAGDGRGDVEQPVRLLAFHLLDGTATVRAYDPAERRVQRGILVPRRFGELVEAAAS
jgi:hypothetical protein